MNWKKIVSGSLDSTYHALEGLLEIVDDSLLPWKPSKDNNWMTMGQLLTHLSTCSGRSFQGLITGEWDFPADFDPDHMTAEQMLPPAEKLPTTASVSAVKNVILADKDLAYKLLDQLDDERLAKEFISVPWDKREMPLGARLLDSIDHLASHKGQLFYYLKLLGKPVNTIDMWGMKP